MRRHSVLLVGVLVAITALPEIAQAQFALSPRGLLGMMTAPLRGALGAPRARHHRPMPRSRAPEAAAGAGAAAAASQQAAASTPDRAETARGREGAARAPRPGPLSAPTVYTEVIGYALWPNAYDARYRQLGFGDIVTSIVGPLNASANVASAQTSDTTGSASPDTPSVNAPADVKAACASRAANEQDWPATQIRQTVNLSNEAKSALDTLQRTVVDAGKDLDAGCGDTDLTPIKRLEALKQRLWAIQSADNLTRAPLKTFYAALSDSQKSIFNQRQENLKEAQRPRDQRAERRATNAQPAANAAPMGQQYQICAGQSYGDPERLMQQMQQAIRPTPEQRAAVEAFGKTSGEMAKMMIASCAQPVANNPLARLDAANNQLTTMNHVATTMQIALNSLYGKLNDEQKARLDALGR